MMVVCAVGALISVVLCTGCGQTPSVAANSQAVTSAASQEPRPTFVTAAAAELRPVERHVSVVGTLNGFEQITITPKVEGRVKVIHYDVGDRVPPGTILLELDDTDYRLALTEAERALDQELAKLGVQELPGDGFDVESLPGVVRAQLLVKNAQQRFERQQRLASARASSGEAYEQAETELKVAQAHLLQSRLDAQSTLAAVRHKQAVVEQARQKLADTRVPAPKIPAPPGAESRPANYVVSKRTTAVGEMVRAFPSTAVMELVLDDALKFKATVPERYMSQVKVDQKVAVQVDAWPNEVFPARLSRIYPTVNPESRTFEVEALVPNESHRLMHGGFAKAAIVTQQNDRAVTVPMQSLVSFAGITKVFRVRDGRAEEVQVKVGVRGDGWVEVLGDLEPNDIVATSGQSQLSQGAPIELRQTESRTAALLKR